MKKVYILAALALLGQPCWAQIRDFQTTRLISTAGAGVASVLSTEAAILNPAASAFFQGSSFSYHQNSTALENKSEERTTNNDHFSNNNRSRGAFLADHSGPVKGGFAYIDQRENDFKRERMTLHGAAPMGQRSSMGVSYSYIMDKNPREFRDRHQIHHQLSLGTTYVVDEKTLLGVVVIDPTRTTPGEERALAGFQYTLGDRLTLMGDIGTQYTKDVREEYLWRAAVQVNVFDDLFIRAGRFFDNITKFKGAGWGVSWIGPRMGLEFAQRFSDQFGSGSYIYKDEKLVDTSLSAVIKF